jgi:hypothetical protein
MSLVKDLVLSISLIEQSMGRGSPIPSLSGVLLYFLKKNYFLFNITLINSFRLSHFYHIFLIGKIKYLKFCLFP